MTAVIKKYTQLPLADLFRQSVYSRMAGYEDVNDAERLSQEPTFRRTGRVEAVDSPRRVVLDMDSTEIPVYGQQEEFRTLPRRERPNGL